MAPVIRIGDDVMNELKKRAVSLDMVFSTVNDVLREVLELNRTDENAQRDTNKQKPSQLTNVTFPKSNNPHVQKLIDGIRPVIFSLSNGGLRLYPKSGKWIAEPNFVAIKVQDARGSNIAITVYGHPEDFETLRHNLNIRADRPGHSRFNFDREEQLQSVIEVIRHAYQLHLNRNPRFSR
ncbi:hypothetical protein ES703_59242 [subsurface metagenome]